MTRAGPNIVFQPDERVFLAGATGTGKTYFARRMMRQAPRFVTIDPKHTFRIDGVPILSKFDRKKPRQILRPPVFGVGEKTWYMEQYNAAFAALRGQNAIIYTDEVNATGSPQQLNPGLDRIIRQGRELHIAAWMATQRPSLIPSTLFTEASHVLVFALLYDGDKDKVEAFCGPTAREILDVIGDPEEIRRGRCGPHDFMYFNVRQRRAWHVRQSS